MTLTHQQVADIIQKAPTGTTASGIVSSLRKNGYKLEGYDEATKSIPIIQKPVDTNFNPLGISKLGQVVSGIAKGGFETLKGAMDTSETLLKQGAKQQLGQMIPGGQKLFDVASQKVGQGLQKIGYQPNQSVASNIQSTVEQKKGVPQGTLLKGSTPIEKVAKTATEVAGAFAPLGEGASAAEGVSKTIGTGKELLAYNAWKKALELSPEELAKVNGKKLDWLSKDVLSTGKTKGGLLKSKTYEMPQKMKDLGTEFKDILKGTPEQIRLNAENTGKGLRQNILDLFSNNEKAINQNQFVSKLKKAVADDTNIVYDTVKQQKETVDKAVKSFSKYITRGTNKGLEEANTKWYSESKNASGKLSDANKVIQKVIKTTIKDTLPEEQKTAYDTLKTKMAKLYDIQEIMKAKVKASVGTSVLKNVANKLKIPAGTIATYEGAKKLITGQW